jgi:magnesium chelatase accessory protein
MARGLDWQADGRDWPHRERSRFIDVAGQRWHVQAWPAPRPGAPLLLLLHGTGASTHSWRSLAPLLARHFELLAPDLPGHAFSGPAPGDGASLPGMAQGVQALLDTLGARPAALVGHSAGAAIAIRMALQAQQQGRPGAPCILALNAALFPLPGLGGALYSPVAKLLALNSLVPRLFAWHAGSPRVLQQLLDSTGSRIDAAGTSLYGRIVRSPVHVAGTLAMVSRWDLPALVRELPLLRTPLHLLVGGRDGTVPPADGRRAQALVAGSTLHLLPTLGHLAHEEQPAEVAAWAEGCVATLRPDGRPPGP